MLTCSRVDVEKKLFWGIMIVLQVLSISLLVTLCYTLSLEKAVCTIYLKDTLPETLPLLIKPNGGQGNDAYYLPANYTGKIVINAEDIIELSCPGGSVTLKGGSIGVEVAEATCSLGRNFNVNKQIVSINDISCSTHPVETARYTGKSCLGNKKEIEIGFNLPKKFIRHMTICFDAVNQITLYSFYDMPQSINGYQVGYPRTDFVEDNFYDIGKNTVDNLYRYHKSTINRLLGYTTSDNSVITNTFYLNKGHLAAKADFIFGSVQRTTFHYVNAAPQWKLFNDGNWNTLEQNTRDFVGSNKLNVLVYTGTYGVITLQHKNGNYVPIYLYGENGKRGLPVPEIFWRVVYEPKTQLGVAFVGVNNPYVKENYQKYCSDVCRDIKWLTWQATNNTLGYGYCCEVNELRKAIQSFPDIPVKGLLI